MRICFITKYPPIEGGESSKSYWLARGLGKKGVKVYIITNAWEVETEFREKMEVEDLYFYQPKNVKVFNTDPFINPSFIPYTKPYTEKIASLALDVINSYDLQIIDSSYILPYGIAGYLVKSITKLPQILKHAGSDITRLFESPYLHTLFFKILFSVDKIITTKFSKEFLINLGISESKLVLNKVSVDLEVFNPHTKPFKFDDIPDIPIISFIGKCEESKGIYELLNALHGINEDFFLLLITGGKNIQKLNMFIQKSKLKSKTIIMPFMPPWKIPSVIKASTCVIMPERDFPIAIHTPILPRECWATGTCTLLSEELYKKRPFKEIKENIHTLVVNPKDIDEFRKKLEYVIKNPDECKRIGMEASKISKKREDFNGYIKQRKKIYKNILI